MVRIRTTTLSGALAISGVIECGETQINTRDEMNTLKEYEDALASMTVEEKEELREWTAHVNSLNSNLYALYGENGCLMDLIASRQSVDNPYEHMWGHEGAPVDTDHSLPF